ncbi:LIC_10740 family protein [Leptospira idonii]|uniref:Uncharacterized protein n=1 Tax=Leptospira idonii TaxID=1193500 RepID=A0A4R9M0D7_9LEPT|nr:hypothetical protein [Leptospira idonii]TGN20174.1 hypothetical protein EHS15_05650 [Leptospira idonii]
MLHPKIKEYSAVVKEKAEVYGSQFYRIGTGKDKTTPEFIFLFFSWFSLLLFFTFFILAEKNPFNLLVPFNVFQLPSHDPRSYYKVTISDGAEQEIAVNRKILADENPSSFVYQLVKEVGSPPYFLPEENPEIQGIVFVPKKLLDLHYSLKNVWFRSEGKVLILDWNEEMLESVMNVYRLPRLSVSSLESEDDANAPEDTITYYSGGESSGPKESEEVTRQRKLTALGVSFRAIDSTLFANFPELKTIQHKLNGETREYPGLAGYDFSSDQNRK